MERPDPPRPPEAKPEVTVDKAARVIGSMVGRRLAERRKDEPIVDLGIAGRRAAVAGASAGLGLATARALAAEGRAGRRSAARSADRLDAAAASIDGDVVAVVGDVSTPDGATALGRAAADALGGVDILVAQRRRAAAGQLRLDRPRRLRARARAQPALGRRPLQGAGATDAGGGLGSGRRHHLDVGAPAHPDLILSNTARAGATGFLKTLALEVAGDGVTVNSVLPGTHDTDRIRSPLRRRPRVGRGRRSPSARSAGPRTSAPVVAFLCSDHARFITGAAMPVDGGAIQGLL